MSKRSKISIASRGKRSKRSHEHLLPKARERPNRYKYNRWDKRSYFFGKQIVSQRKDFPGICSFLSSKDKQHISDREYFIKSNHDSLRSFGIQPIFNSDVETWEKPLNHISSSVPGLEPFRHPTLLNKSMPKVVQMSALDDEQGIPRIRIITLCPACAKFSVGLTKNPRYIHTTTEIGRLVRKTIRTKNQVEHNVARHWRLSNSNHQSLRAK